MAHFISKDEMEEMAVSEAGKRKGMRGKNQEIRSYHAEGTASSKPSSSALHMHEFPRGMCLLGAC